MSTAIAVSQPKATNSHLLRHKGFVAEKYPEEVRLWCVNQPEGMTTRAIAAACQDRFPSPWPDHSTIARWKDAERQELRKLRNAVWEREWAERASAIVPAAIVSLDRARQEAFELMERSVRRAAVAEAKINAIEAEDDTKVPLKLLDARDSAESTMLRAAKEAREASVQILTFCGAIKHEPEADPAAIRQRAVAGWLAEGVCQTRQEAEARFDELAGAAGAPALGEGEAEE